MTTTVPAPSRPRALVVGRDHGMREQLADLLRRSGFVVTSTSDDDLAAAVADRGRLELAVVDPSPDPHRSQLLHRLRQRSRLLLVRLRRDPTPAVPDLEVDRLGLRVHRRGEPIRLTRHEMRLLCAFLDNPGRVLSRQALRDLVWEGNDVGRSRVVDMSIHRLRQRIEDDPAAPRYLQTVPGHGYRLAVSAAQPGSKT